MLRCWGIDAEASTWSVGTGEIDVTFAHNGERYLIEAKWESSKIDIGPIAKLEKRLKQRLRWPIGIVLSMSGFTREAAQGIDKGSQLEVLLFDRSHFEAMLSGFVPPQELLKLAHDEAAFRGVAYSTVLGLLKSSRSSRRSPLLSRQNLQAGQSAQRQKDLPLGCCLRCLALTSSV
jgi:hypothetical protein